MKLAHSGMGSVVASEGVQTTSAFNIARTPHMFNILSSGLYSDKVGAVLREIGCNAMDAHIMGGCPDKPFQVKLPTPLDPSFYVKDWGPGLDDKELRELYTTYGWSSKQNNDDVTGAFGLGSKSPFAYTLQNEDSSDGFTVESAKNGVKRIYTCYIDDNGAPAISRLYEGPADADWPHGVKVTFPVQARDVSEFHEKARDIYRWFRVKPELLGASFKLESLDFKFNGEFFGLQPENASGALNSPCIIMGNVRYPINASRLRELTTCEEALLKANITMNVPMGTVMMTPSREELEYTERTRRGLKEWLGKAADEMAKTVREKVMAPEDTTWEWYKKIQTYYSTLPFGVQHRIEAFLEHAGVDADEIKKVATAVKEKTAQLPNWVGDGLAGPTVVAERDANGVIVRDAEGNVVPAKGFDPRGARVWLYQTGETRSGNPTVRRREIVNGKVRSGSEYAPVHLSFLNDVRVYYVDSKTADPRVRAAMRENANLSTLIVVQSCRGTEVGYAEEYAKRLTSPQGLHGLPMYATSTLPVPDSVEEEKLRRKLAKEQGPKAMFADTDIHYLALNNNVVTTTFSELEETDQFYVVCNKMDQMSRARFKNSDGSRDYSFNGYYRGEMMAAFKTVVEELGLPVTGCIVVPTEGAARRLKLAEQGFKPFLPVLAQALEEKGNWEKLTARIDRTPRVDLTQMWRADDYGYLGILGHHATTVSEFWKSFVRALGHTELPVEVLDFVARSHESSETAQEQESLRYMMATLQNHFQGVRLSQLGSVDRLSYYEVRRLFQSKYPQLDALNESTMVQWMEKQPARALAAFVAVFELGTGLAEDAKTEELLAA